MAEKTWRETLEELKALDAEYKRVGMTWTQDALDSFARKRKAIQRESSKQILDGASKELLTKVEYFQQVRKKFLSHKQEEINSWNSTKLASEYAVQSVIFDMVAVGVNKLGGDSVSKRVGKLFTEARDGKDKYKMRAFADLLSGVKVKISDSEDLKELNKYEEQARETLQEMRETPEMAKSRDELFKAFDYFSAGMREYRDIVRDAGEVSPDHIFATGEAGQLYNRIEVSKDEDGLPDVKLLEKDKRFL